MYNGTSIKLRAKGTDNMLAITEVLFHLFLAIGGVTNIVRYIKTFVKSRFHCRIKIAHKKMHVLRHCYIRMYLLNPHALSSSFV